ncbi:MAG: hypothetical protein RIQ62_1596 [Bacteroidota bacterium]
MGSVKKILIAPLDWGLGHATRCIPIIRWFCDAGAEVIIGGNGASLLLLRNEFPALKVIQLPDYQIRYSRTKKGLPLVMLLQIPKILQVISQEHKRLNQIVKAENLDLIISDNRYGLYHDRVRCIFLTHQLQIQVPQSLWLQKIVNVCNHRLLQRFHRIWVPDVKAQGISGRLSDAPSLGHVDFIGLLSRMEYRPQAETRYECLVVLSGPEPQRTLLEEMVLASLQKTKIKTLIVRGLPENTNRRMVSPWVEIVDYLGATELQDAISQSTILVSRSGYSSVMDWVKIRRHAVLIPTPGQTEQEYLGKHLTQKKWFLSVTQDEFELTDALEQYQKTIFSSFPTGNDEKIKEFCYREINEISL